MRSCIGGGRGGRRRDKRLALQAPSPGRPATPTPAIIPPPLPRPGCPSPATAHHARTHQSGETFGACATWTRSAGALPVKLLGAKRRHLASEEGRNKVGGERDPTGHSRLRGQKGSGNTHSPAAHPPSLPSFKLSFPRYSRAPPPPAPGGPSGVSWDPSSARRAPPNNPRIRASLPQRPQS